MPAQVLHGVEEYIGGRLVHDLAVVAGSSPSTVPVDRRRRVEGTVTVDGDPVDQADQRVCALGRGDELGRPVAWRQREIEGEIEHEPGGVSSVRDEHGYRVGVLAGGSPIERVGRESCENPAESVETICHRSPGRGDDRVRHHPLLHIGCAAYRRDLTTR
jgi:hypothetical protein